MSAEDEEAKMATEEFVAEYSDEHKIRPYSGTPKKDGVASAGDASTGFACGDHVHPTDTSRMAANATGANIAVSGSDPTKISAALAGKADSATTYTKDEVDEIVASVKNGSRQIVASLNDVTDPKPLVIYMVAKQSAQTKNAYDEYIWMAAGAWEKIGDTEIDLSGYVPKETGKGLSTNDYTTKEKTKLEGIEADAQVNVIETVKVNGTALTPQDKAVNIPVPTLDNTVTPTSGNGVKSSGIWAAIWGTASTAFSSLYDWCVAQLAGKASTADATLTERFSAWTILRDGVDVTEQVQQPYWSDDPDAAYVDEWVILGTYVQGDFGESTLSEEPRDAVALSWYGISDSNIRHSYTATRTALQGYQLGPDEQTNPNRDKPLASEAEAEALRNGKLDKSGGTMTGPLTIVRSGDNIKFDGSTIRFNDEDGSATGGTISGTEGGGDVTLPTYSGTLALTADIPYSLGTKIISNNAVTLDDRASNSVTISATLSPNKLTINFPTAPTGKLRDFAMRLNIAAGVTAPEIAWPQGVTLENDGGEMPEIADGGTGGSSTILYFSETENNGTTAKFLVKGETLTAITQA